MKLKALCGVATAIILGSGQAYSQEELGVGSLSIGGRLLLESYVHRLGDHWTARRAGLNGINYNYFYNPSVSTDNDWETTFGTTLFLDVGARPFENLTADLGFEILGQYADRYWKPVNLEHRMKLEDESFAWTRGDIRYTADWWSLRYFRGVGHYNWTNDGDLFDLYPAQYDTATYLRVSGRPVPEAFELTMSGPAGVLDLTYGPEALWDYRNGVYARYHFTLRNHPLNLFYRDHEIPYGEPGERMRTVELSSGFDIASSRLEAGVLYQPFRLDRDYTYVDSVAPGTGKLGSGYIEKTGTTGVQDALGASTKLTLRPSRLVDELALKYTYLGLVAGNRQEFSTQFFRWLSQYFLGSVEYSYRKPLIGPVPLVYEGAPGNTGPAIFTPRGPDSPFWVGWKNSLGTWENREASRFSFILTFDPTPDTWFYRYEPNTLGEWNLNPEEDARLSFALRYDMVRYFTATDRLLYWNENGHMVWEPAVVSGAWPSDGYLGTTTLISKMFLPNWRIVYDLGFGEAPALNSFAYTTSTVGKKPITGFFTTGVVANTGRYTLRLRYGENVWGPEEWHPQFGQAFDRLYQAGVSRTFGDLITAGVEYVGARETDHKYLAVELGEYDEFRAFFTVAFGPVVPYFGTSRPAVSGPVGEAPAMDFTRPQVTLTLSTTTFTPNGDGINDVLEMRPWAVDYSGIAEWRISVADENGTVVKTIGDTGQPPYRVEWDGTDDVYGKVVPEGTYSVTLAATDQAGNSAVTEPHMVTVKIPPMLVIKEVVKDASDLKVEQTERGLLVSFTSHVLFGFGRSSLRAGSNRNLDEVLKILQAYPENRIAVEGHTDSIGSSSYNQKLSETRAWSVANYLIEHGIAAERIKVVGYGEDRPIASNSTADGRQTNRRVEVIILR